MAAWPAAPTPARTARPWPCDPSYPPPAPTTLTIYDIATSRAIRPLWAAEELDLIYRHIKLHHAATETKALDYLRLNPNQTARPRPTVAR